VCTSLLLAFANAELETFLVEERARLGPMVGRVMHRDAASVIVLVSYELFLGSTQSKVLALVLKVSSP
jgi:hypothetical protein